MSKDKKQSVAEKLSDSAAEVNHGGDFEKLVGELQKDIQQVAVDFNAKLQELDNINIHKKNAKVRYQRALDEGEQETMALCLKQVREQNSKAAELEIELQGFPKLAEELYAKQTKIVAIAQDGQSKSEADLRAAEKSLKLTKEKVKRCYAVQGLINDVNKDIEDLVRTHKKEKKAFEDEVRVPRDNSRGFWLESSDPFAEGALRTYKNLKAPIDKVKLQKKFKASEELRSEFSDLKSYLDFERKNILKSKDLDDMNLPCVLSYEDEVTKATLQNYIVRAGGGGDRHRAFSARVALQKCR